MEGASLRKRLLSASDYRGKKTVPFTELWDAYRALPPLRMSGFAQSLRTPVCYKFLCLCRKLSLGGDCRNNCALGIVEATFDDKSHASRRLAAVQRPERPLRELLCDRRGEFLKRWIQRHTLNLTRRANTEGREDPQHRSLLNVPGYRVQPALYTSFRQTRPKSWFRCTAHPSFSCGGLRLGLIGN